MNEIGHYSACLAWFLSLFGVLAGLYAGYSSKRRWFLSVIASTTGASICVTIATFALGYLFLHDDYTNAYVWQYSNKDMNPIYKFTAIWGGMDGSMLLWCFMLSVSSFLVAFNAKSYPRLLAPWVLAVANSSVLFFLTITVFVTNPFRFLRAPFIPPDGNGLNPLLQNPYMAIHPPMLYLGFTTHAIPFAFCLGALLSGQLSNDWIRLIRTWTLAAWGFLTCGIVLGGYWAYIELGWGGFWAWDPVENSSFLPWLTSTAFLHSIMVQERKNMLKIWNIWLMIVTYGLTVFGTFLTRSGVVQSVHAFASTDVGWVFLAYLALLLLVAIVLTIYRRSALRPERKIESLLSREAFFLLNNLVLLSICFAVLWGVLFPVLSEAVTGQKQAVGIPFFNAVNVPLFLLLIFLMGVGPLIAWRRAAPSAVARTFVWPFLLALGIAILLVWAGIDEFYPVLSYALCFFVFMTLMGELHRGVRAQKVSAAAAAPYLSSAARLVKRHRQRYGGYLVHFGVLVMTVAITASMAHKFEKDFGLKVGESKTFRRFTLTLEDVHEGTTPNYAALYATVKVRLANSGQEVAVLKPEMRSYFRNQESTTEVAIKTGIREDLYLVLAGLDDSGTTAALKIFINPLQVWLWIGTLIMLVGTGVVIVPVRQPARSPALQGILETS
ncbi:MAG: cytochrome C biogenesis protein [Proteobacteria bacterium]|nr:MAG: cytochrome C biogenesis protein [Pseudomonadota bacterium]